MMHETHDTIRDGGDGAAICINCACCECHRPEVATAPCAKAPDRENGRLQPAMDPEHHAERYSPDVMPDREDGGQ